MNIKFEVENIDSLTLLDETALRNAMGRALGMVERKAKEKAPKDTGALRRSITSEITQEGNELVGYVFTPLEYAPYVEYGTGLFAENGNGRKDVPWGYIDEKGEWHSTRGQKPQPYMRPALNESREEIVRIFKEALK